MALVGRQAQQLSPGLCPCDCLHRSLPRVAERHVRTSANRTAVAPASHEAVWRRLRSLLTSAASSERRLSRSVTPPGVVSALQKTQTAAKDATRDGCAGARVLWPGARSGESGTGRRARLAAPSAPGALSAGRTALLARTAAHVHAVRAVGRPRDRAGESARGSGVGSRAANKAPLEGRPTRGASLHRCTSVARRALLGLGLRMGGASTLPLACAPRHGPGTSFTRHPVTQVPASERAGHQHPC